MRDCARTLRSGRGETVVPRVCACEGDPRIIDRICLSNVLVVVRRAAGSRCYAITRDGIAEVVPSYILLCAATVPSVSSLGVIVPTPCALISLEYDEEVVQ